MVFESKVPQQDGRYRWRLNKGERIHTVRVETKRGTQTFRCSTMAVEALKMGGEWSFISGLSQVPAEPELV